MTGLRTCSLSTQGNCERIAPLPGAKAMIPRYRIGVPVLHARITITVWISLPRESVAGIGNDWLEALLAARSGTAPIDSK